VAGFVRRVRRQSRRDKAAQAARERTAYMAYLKNHRSHPPHDGFSHGRRVHLCARERRELKRIVNASKSGQVLVLRARVVLLAASGLSNNAIAGSLQTDVKTVRKWRNRYAELRRPGLDDAPRSGRPPIFTPQQRHNIIAKSLTEPPEGLARWTCSELVGVAVREAIVGNISKETIARWLRIAEIKPHRYKYWLNSKDPEFHSKMAAVVDLYVDPPADGIVLCVDEKTGIQALASKAPEKPVKRGQIRKIEFEYGRKGTVSLMASFNTQTGEVVGQCIESNNSETFIAFVTKLMEHYPAEKKLYLVLDNGSSHKSKATAAFLERHKDRVQAVYLPVHASWLNQVEIWFSVLSRKCLKTARFSSQDKLRTHIEKFIARHNQYDKHPYRWTYTGQPLTV
jgi:transposase